jgi:hypothetical protein
MDSEISANKDTDASKCPWCSSIITDSKATLCTHCSGTLNSQDIKEAMPSKKLRFRKGDIILYYGARASIIGVDVSRKEPYLIQWDSDGIGWREESDLKPYRARVSGYSPPRSEEQKASIVSGCSFLGCCILVIAAIIVAFVVPMPDHSMNPISIAMIGIGIAFGCVGYVAYQFEKHFNRVRFYRQRASRFKEA